MTQDEIVLYLSGLSTMVYVSLMNILIMMMISLSGAIHVQSPQCGTGPCSKGIATI